LRCIKASRLDQSKSKLGTTGIHACMLRLASKIWLQYRSSYTEKCSNIFLHVFKLALVPAINSTTPTITHNSSARSSPHLHTTESIDRADDSPPHRPPRCRIAAPLLPC
uniref:Uncharacterized protein n=1 Tax=Aegilops tauschii subsp. strangulata TaxID=200361 RepID=A0A453A153_AEGTS